MMARLLSEWSLMRLMRLGFGIFAGVQSYQMHDYFLGFLSGIFLLQAYTNTGCCGAQGCEIPIKTQKPIQDTEMNQINH